MPAEADEDLLKHLNEDLCNAGLHESYNSVAKYPEMNMFKIINVHFKKTVHPQTDEERAP